MMTMLLTGHVTQCANTSTADADDEIIFHDATADTVTLAGKKHVVTIAVFKASSLLFHRICNGPQQHIECCVFRLTFNQIIEQRLMRN